MRQATLAIAALVVVASALAVALWIGREGPEAALTAPATTAEHDAARADAALVAGAEAQAVDTAPSDEPADARRPLAAPEAEIAAPAAADDELATIRGRCVFADGSPLAGVAWDAGGWRANEERALRYGLPDSWTGPEGTTAADGRFVARFEAPRAYQFSFDLAREGYAAESWRWSEILPGAVVDLGDVVMERGGAIEGMLVDAGGEPLRQHGWRAYAEALRVDRGPNRENPRVRVDVDAGSGRFRLEDVRPGPAQLEAKTAMASVDGPRIDVVAGETVETVIRYAGPDTSRRIAVSTYSRPLRARASPAASSIRLHGAGPEPLVAQQTPVTGGYFFDDLAPGTYRIEIDDEHFLPWSRDGVEPGTQVRAQLEGNAALALDVRERATGEPVELYAVRVAHRNVNFFPNEFEVHDGEEPLPDGLVRVFPGDYRVTVLSPEHAPAAVDVDGVQPHETRVVEVLVGEPIELGGRVVRSDGSPGAGLEVLLLRLAEVDDSPESGVLRRMSSSSREREMRRELASTDAGSDGRFVFSVPMAGAYALRAQTPTGLAAATEALDVAPGRSRTDVELVVSLGGWIEGRVVGPPGADFTGLEISTLPESRDITHRMWFRDAGPFELEPDGTFRVGPLAPGPTEVALVVRIGSGGFSTANDVPLGTVHVPEGGVVSLEASVTDRFPGRVEVAALRDGEPPVDALAVFRALSEAPITLFTAPLDVHGRVGPLLVHAGTWTVGVRTEGEPWEHVHPEPIVVEPAGSATVELRVETAAATIEVRDAATEEPVAGVKLDVLSVDPETGEPRSEQATFAGQRVATDHDGRARLVLSPGDYVLRTLSGALEGALVWTFTGPDRDVVRLEKNR